MTRFKRELIKRDLVTLQETCDYTPFDLPSGVCLESTVVNAETCTVTQYYDVIVLTQTFNRQMKGHTTDWE